MHGGCCRKGRAHSAKRYGRDPARGAGERMRMRAVRAMVAKRIRADSTESRREDAMRDGGTVVRG
jgi:hypothetical protein